MSAYEMVGCGSCRKNTYVEGVEPDNTVTTRENTAADIGCVDNEKLWKEVTKSIQ